MAECKECFHYEVCSKLIGKDKIDRVSWMCHFPDQCSEFKSTIPQTNADRIRAMSDKELAHFMAERSVNEYTVNLLDKDAVLTAVQIEALKHNIYCDCLRWLKQPVEVKENA